MDDWRRFINSSGVAAVSRVCYTRHCIKDYILSREWSGHATHIQSQMFNKSSEPYNDIGCLFLRPNATNMRGSEISGGRKYDPWESFPSSYLNQTTDSRGFKHIWFIFKPDMDTDPTSTFIRRNLALLYFVTLLPALLPS